MSPRNAILQLSSSTPYTGLYELAFPLYSINGFVLTVDITACTELNRQSKLVQLAFHRFANAGHVKNRLRQEQQIIVIKLMLGLSYR